MPSEPDSASNPARATVDVTRASTPIGSTQSTQPMARIRAWFRPSITSSAVRPASPIAESPSPIRMLKVISPSGLAATISLNTFFGTSWNRIDRHASWSEPTSPEPTAAGRACGDAFKAAAAAGSMPDPGAIHVTSTAPRAAAIAMVDTKNASVAPPRRPSRPVAPRLAAPPITLRRISRTTSSSSGRTKSISPTRAKPLAAPPLR